MLNIKTRKESDSGSDRIVGGFATTYAISAYHQQRCDIEFRLGEGLQDTTVSDLHDITEILLKVALNNLILTPEKHKFFI